MLKSNSKCQISLKTDRKYSEKGKMSVTSTFFPPQCFKTPYFYWLLKLGWYGKEAKSTL